MEVCSCGFLITVIYTDLLHNKINTPTFQSSIFRRCYGFDIVIKIHTGFEQPDGLTGLPVSWLIIEDIQGSFRMSRKTFIPVRSFNSVVPFSWPHWVSLFACSV